MEFERLKSTKGEIYEWGAMFYGVVCDCGMFELICLEDDGVVFILFVFKFKCGGFFVYGFFDLYDWCSYFSAFSASFFVGLKRVDSLMSFNGDVLFFCLSSVFSVLVSM